MDRIKAIAAKAESTKTDRNAAAAERGALVVLPGGTPDYFGPYSNWANSPIIRKFVDPLPLPGYTHKRTASDPAKYIPIAVPDIVTYPGSDYYEIGLQEYEAIMHSDLPNPTRLRGYVQLNKGTDTTLCATPATCTSAANQIAPPAKPYYGGPLIVAQKDRPVRILFKNQLPTGAAGKLFVPVDLTVMGAGPGPNSWSGAEKADVVCKSAQNAATPPACFAENRATVHLHGGKTPWISDGTPHQWVVPAGENTLYPKGMSVFNVPDMPDPGPGALTFYFTNQQSSRLSFYHDHASGTTRLNVYVGEAAGYLIRDEVETKLLDSGVIPKDEIPLIIQDKTFVDAANVRRTDPTWNWGTGPYDPVTGIRTPKTGDLWWPHVYVPAQNPYDITGVNPWGRWVYGPWFWPPTNNIEYPPVVNEYYDPTCDPDVRGYCEPPMRPGTPNVSWGGEAFLDTPLINGTAYPYLEVEPKAYRFRVLNAAHDRFWNLQLYKADTTAVAWAGRTEVRMVPAVACNCNNIAFPDYWPLDGREGGVPDPTNVGPSWIQIGTESGFLPMPAEIPIRPVSWNGDPTTFNAGNVDGGSLLLGPAERADVIVDFSKFAGETIILYNDAPAAFPALDPRYDYYTGNPDLTDTGGAPSTQPGYGPNTRTLMQIRVKSATPAPAYSFTALRDAFLPSNAAIGGVFKKGQEDIIVGQKFYNDAYAMLFPKTWPNWGISRIQDNSLSFMNTAGQVKTLPMQPKAIHDEMGAAYDEYGRMSAKLGLEVPFTGNVNQTFILRNYVDPSTEIVGVSQPGPVADSDGTQIWKITHNGVDTHPVHFHLFDVQLINRVGWDGAIRPPDPNELGWKDTIRISPLEDTIVAVRPIAPKPPFGIPNSLRPLNPALPIGATVGFTNIDVIGNPITPVVKNEIKNFDWEYVWHCHILSHEEADMMRPINITVPSQVPPAPTGLAREGTALPLKLTWTDGTPAALASTLGNPANEIGFRIERSGVTAGVPSGTFQQVGKALANATLFTDQSATANMAYAYRVVAYNQAGETASVPLIVEPSATTLDAPTTLAGTPSGNTVALTWAYPTGTAATGFLVQRATDAGFSAGLTAFPVADPAARAYSDTNVANGTYFYRVLATATGTQSAPSNVIQVVVGTGSTLNAPTNLAATIAAGPTVTLTWVDNSTTETAYRVERATVATFTDAVALPDQPANTTSIIDRPAAGTYYYRVLALEGATLSVPSAALQVGPPLNPSNVRAQQPTTNVVITWTDLANNESGYAITRVDQVTNAAVTFNSGLRPGTGSVGSFSDRPQAATNPNGFKANTSYTYTVRAVNALGSSTGVSATITTKP